MYSCKKDWLELKPRQALALPNTVPQLQALCDYDDVFNSYHPVLGELGSDDYYLPDENYTNLAEGHKNNYKWASGSDFYAGSIGYQSVWDRLYNSIFYANTILENIEKVVVKTNSDSAAWKNVKGTAHFYRAFINYNLVQVYGKPYGTGTESTDPGIILRKEPDVNLKLPRSSVKETYDFILSDLNQSLQFLPANQEYKTRPSIPAAFGLLARVYLSMSDYDMAFLNADSCLKRYNTLLDYNTFANPTDYFAIEMYNPEVIFHSRMSNINSSLPLIFQLGRVDSVLYSLYDNNDLRKIVCFIDEGGVAYKGSYYGFPVFLFNGLATDEIYIIRAECSARKGQVSDAMNDINAILANRWDDDAVFTPLTAADQEDALNKVLIERRKELCFRGLRWSDLRRFNLEPGREITLQRKIGDETFVLPPNSERYVYPIPQSEMLFNPVVQNPR